MKKIIAFFICLIFLNLFVFADTQNPTKYEAKYYDNAKVVRVKYSTGEAFVQRSYDEGLEEATVNLPLFEKDKVGNTDGRIELYNLKDDIGEKNNLSAEMQGKASELRRMLHQWRKEVNARMPVFG